METAKCLNCGKEVAQKKGKRSKLYCSDLCRATYHQKKKQEQKVSKVFTVELPKDYLSFEKIMVLKEDGTMIPIDELPKTGYDGLWLQAFGALKEVTKDSGEPLFFEYNPTNEKVVPIDTPLAGKAVTVTIPSSAHNPSYKNNDELILQYETELKGLGEGKFAAARKKWLINKINELKNVR